ncbi:MAG: class I SAM-dependent methyltransferase, partial [Sphingomonadales bacterium]|nr:class I SAM-dependent methyltransferase [Sphingomonadales bacterium]
SMYDILLELNRFPQRFLLPGADKKSFRARVKPIAARRFANRDFKGGIAELQGKVDYRIAELTSLEVADGELGFVVSIATLEHVADPATIYRWLFRKSRPTGGQFHYIDLCDHRAYGSDSKFDAWSFLTEENASPNVNRLRAHEHLELIRQAGFEVVREERVTNDIPPATRERLIAPWRSLPKEELETVGLRLLLRRPA